jgi:UTP:GlnB (protein PII) uridylyltransferase
MVQTLDRQDQEVVYMVCDLMSQEKERLKNLRVLT